jgi:hypothetical protein
MVTGKPRSVKRSIPHGGKCRRDCNFGEDARGIATQSSFEYKEIAVPMDSNQTS